MGAGRRDGGRRCGQRALDGGARQASAIHGSVRHDIIQEAVKGVGRGYRRRRAEVRGRGGGDDTAMTHVGRGLWMRRRRRSDSMEEEEEDSFLPYDMEERVEGDQESMGCEETEMGRRRSPFLVRSQ